MTSQQPTIIALGHKSRRGKDTVAQMLTEILPGKVKRGSFAGPLKQAAHLIWGHYGLRDGAYYEGEPAARTLPVGTTGKDAVQLWIELGQKVREICPATWVDAGLAEAKDCDYFILTDLRFPNEADAVLARGGLCVRVDNPRVNGERDSDRFLDGFARWSDTIVNDGSLEDLVRKVRAFVNSHWKTVITESLDGRRRVKLVPVRYD